MGVGWNQRVVSGAVPEAYAVRVMFWFRAVDLLLL